MAGRPTKLDSEMHKRIIGLVRAGNYIETAASASGVPRVKLYDWLKRGNKEAIGQYRDFVEAFHSAESESEAIALQSIAKAGQGDEVTIVKEKFGADGELVERTTERRREKNWTAAAWRLERRFPAKWGKRFRVDPEDGEADRSGLLNKSVRYMSDGDIAAAISRMGSTRSADSDNRDDENRPENGKGKANGRHT